MGATRGNRVMAFACVIGTIGGHRSNTLIGLDLVEQLRQHGCVAHIAGRDLDGTNLQRFLVDPDVYFAPNPALRPAVLAGIPLAFALRLDARAVDQKVQRTGSTAIRQANFKCRLAAAKGAEIWHRPVQSDQLQQALDKACRLPERHAEQNLQRQAGLDRGVTELLSSTAFARRRRYPDHLGSNQIDSDSRRFKLLL